MQHWRASFRQRLASASTTSSGRVIRPDGESSVPLLGSDWNLTTRDDDIAIRITKTNVRARADGQH